MTTLTPDDADELRELRRRAYGPGAGSGLAQADVERLLELEDRAKAGDPPPSSTTDDPPGAPHDSATADLLDAAVAPPIEPSRIEEVRADAPAPAGVPWWRRRSFWIAAAAGIAIGAVSAVTVGMLRTLPPTDVLRPTDKVMEDVSRLLMGSAVPFDVESVQHYGPLSRLDVWTAARADGATCLILSSIPEDAQSGSLTDLRCAARGLDPQIDLWIWEGSSEYLGLDLPTQSNVRFLARGGVVDVWVQPARDATDE